MILTAFYTPILMRYSNFEDEFQAAIERIKPEQGLDDETLPLFLNAVSQFNFEEVKTLIGEFPVNIGQMLYNWQDDFFEQHYAELKPVFQKYAADERTVQNARNGLVSFTRIFHNDLIELEKSWRYIDSALNQANDSTANTRTGLTGGSIGAIIGSIVFPGLGTIAGGALGGYLMTKNRTDNLLSQATNHIDNYANHTRHLIRLLHDNAKELYLLAGRIYDHFQVKKLRSAYFELKNTRTDVEQVFNAYLDYHLKDVQSFYSTQIAEGDTSTWGQAAEYVSNFIKNYQPTA
jgi:hypothetical protein